MSKAFKTASSVGAAALLLSGAAAAGAPISEGFDDWSVTGGTITANAGSGGCPTGFTCAVAVTGAGFFQRQVTDTATGKDFFQTIITDETATGGPGSGLIFSDESYVQMGNINGLADKSYIEETLVTGTLTETFEAQTILGTGWASSGGNDEVYIYQGIIADDTAAGAEDFDTLFWLKQLGNQGSVAKHMRISMAVDIVEDVSPSLSSVQDFVLVDLSGTLSTTSATADLGVDGSVSWVAGDAIKATWVGQDLSNIAGVGQEFGFTAYSAGGTDINTFSLAGGSASAPVDWDVPTWGSSSAAGAGPAPF